MRSLRQQLTAGLLISFALLMGGGGAVIYWAMSDSLYEQFDAGLRDKALVVMTQSQQQDGRVAVHFHDFVLRTFDDAVATDFFQVFNLEGRSVERSDSLGIENLPFEYGSFEEPVYWNLTLPNGSPGRALGFEFTPRVASIRHHQEPVTAVVVVASERHQLIETLHDLRLIILATVFSALLLTVLAVWAILRQSLAPIHEVAQTASRIDAESLDQRLPVASLPDELHPLANKLNALLARLQESFDRERRFSSDLAHELRTPVAELQAIAEVALKWPDERTTETDRTILEIARQIESRVGTMLSLARAEQGTLQLRIERVCLESECEELLRPLRDRMTEKKLSLEIDDHSNGLAIETDQVLFRSVLGNLLQNAVSYAPEGSTIGVRMERRGASFSISVENAAPSLQENDLARLFDRFWRKDTARSGGNHAGLGLSLAYTFAALLGLRLAATLDPDKNLVMRVTGPIAVAKQTSSGHPPRPDPAQIS